MYLSWQKPHQELKVSAKSKSLLRVTNVVFVPPINHHHFPKSCIGLFTISVSFSTKRSIVEKEVAKKLLTNQDNSAFTFSASRMNICTVSLEYG
jgi:hypothetical protein